MKNARKILTITALIMPWILIAGFMANTHFFNKDREGVRRSIYREDKFWINVWNWHEPKLSISVDSQYDIVVRSTEDFRTTDMSKYDWCEEEEIEYGREIRLFARDDFDIPVDHVSMDSEPIFYIFERKPDETESLIEIFRLVRSGREVKIKPIKVELR
jgi:hypothetical protein